MRAGADDEDRKDLNKVRKRSGVLIGVGAVGVEESAAVGAQHLDGFLRGHGTLTDGLRLSGLLKRMRGRVRAQVLRNSLPDQQQCVDDARGPQHIEQGARHVDPEVADGGGVGALDAADKSYGDHDARRRRPEVVRGEAGHLGEIAHGGLGRVELPVGVGGEAGGSVPGQIGRDGAKVRGVEGQEGLQALEEVGEKQGDRGEAQHGVRVFAPAHFLSCVDGAELVDEPFAGAQHGVEPGAFALEDAGKVDAHRANRGKQDDAVDGELQPPIGGHSEFLRE